MEYSEKCQSSWSFTLTGDCVRGSVVLVLSLEALVCALGSSPAFYVVVVFPSGACSLTHHISLQWFIEMYCWKCTGQGFLPSPAGSSLSPPTCVALWFTPFFPLSLQSCGTRDGGSLPHFPFYLHTVGVCMRARVRTQVMLLMPAMMIGVMNRHSEDEAAMWWCHPGSQGGSWRASWPQAWETNKKERRQAERNMEARRCMKINKREKHWWDKRFAIHVNNL